MTSLETYIRSLRDIRSTGAAVKETSYYGTLEHFLNDIGSTLKPKVHCVINIQNRGAGLPDGGLFTAEQLQKDSDEKVSAGQIPARGAMEVKGTGDDVWRIAETQQVLDYLERYGQVLVTNYRDFLLLTKDADGNPVKGESYRLAGSEADFWRAANNPQALAEAHGESLIGYLQRVMLHPAPLSSPEDVAWFLASYAKAARKRVENAGLESLAAIRSALEEALGLKFEGRKGDHFFRSTFVQTLFYGVFSAWLLWSKQPGHGDRHELFSWRESAWYLRVPMIRSLFEQLATPTRLGPLNLVEILDWTADTLNRVDRGAFFARFDQGHALQYFYEPFLEQFDPELREDLGVWYTPVEVVKYMVSRVDKVLKEELGRPDGLADPEVYVLDPACGTGAYLVEVLRHIYETLKERGEEALAGFDVKRAAIERVFGFEILSAPFVVSHLQIGLMLQTLGAPLSDDGRERVGVFLTNSLTGWEPPATPKTRLPFPGLEEEREAAERVKREQPILVILGNPPYDGFAGVAIDEERDLSNAYRTTKNAPAPQGQGLNNLYVRFFRMAERRIVEKTGKGIVCFITPYSWLDRLSFTGMRERYLEVFDQVWIDCLNGDRYKTGKLTPEGEPDPSIFSTEMNREGIQVGTCISLMVRKEEHKPAEDVLFRQLWGKDKRSELLAASLRDESPEYDYKIEPVNELGLVFMPIDSSEEYRSWPSLPELFPTSFPGVKTSRDDVVIDVDRGRLVERMEKYFDPDVSHEEMKRISPSAMSGSGSFNAERTRDALRSRGFLRENIKRYCYRPFDLRWLYWEPETKLLDRNRAEYVPHVFEGNLWIEARQKQTMERYDRGYVVSVLSDNFGNGLSSYIPLYLHRSLIGPESGNGHEANLSAPSVAYIGRIGAAEPDLFFHTVAILHSPSYRREHAGALQQDWARIPLPTKKDTLEASAALGRQMSQLLNPEVPVRGVTTGTIRQDLRQIGAITRTEGRIDPNAGDFNITAGWGYLQGTVTMPGRGDVRERAYSDEERRAIEQGAKELGLSLEEAIAELGETTCDVFLNEVAYWKNVPSNVWNYTLGGYQVIKKWLSYRDKRVLDRGLTVDEVREVTNMTRRISTILLLGPALDVNYRAVTDSTYSFSALFVTSDTGEDITGNAAPADSSTV